MKGRKCNTTLHILSSVKEGLQYSIREIYDNLTNLTLLNFNLYCNVISKQMTFYTESDIIPSQEISVYVYGLVMLC